MEQELKKEFNEIKKALKFSEFDTWYVSFLVLSISSILVFLLNKTDNVWKTIFLTFALIMVSISFILQTFAVFSKNYKKGLRCISIILIWGSLLSILMTAYGIFITRTFAKNIIFSAILFFLGLFVIVYLIKYFDKIEENS